jgi:hypothetical protein
MGATDLDLRAGEGEMKLCIRDEREYGGKGVEAMPFRRGTPSRHKEEERPYLKDKAPGNQNSALKGGVQSRVARE